MLKIIGIIMVMGAGFIFSYIKVDELKQRYNNLKETIRGLMLLKNNISFSCRELSDAISDISDSLSGTAGDVFREASDALKKDETKFLGQAWKETKQNFKSGIYLSSDAQKILDELMEILGTMSKDIEIENIEKTIERLKAEEEIESDSFRKNKKLILSLGGIGTLSVLILFI